MEKTVAICFAKTPGVTPAKTRLAKHIGDKKCLDLYILMVKRCRELMLQVQNISRFVAVNEAQSLKSHYWEKLNTYQQLGEDLGTKLANAETFFFRDFEQIIFWGTDSLTLTRDHFYAAKTALETHSHAIIPALDGGFALYAAKTPLKEEAWKKINYSQPTTLEELRAQIKSPLYLAPAISDLDVIEDLPRIIQEMSQMPSQGTAWDELKNFLQTI